MAAQGLLYIKVKYRIGKSAHYETLDPTSVHQQIIPFSTSSRTCFINSLINQLINFLKLKTCINRLVKKQNQLLNRKMKPRH